MWRLLYAKGCSLLCLECWMYLSVDKNNNVNRSIKLVHRSNDPFEWEQKKIQEQQQQKSDDVSLRLCTFETSSLFWLRYQKKTLCFLFLSMHRICAGHLFSFEIVSFPFIFVPFHLLVDFFFICFVSNKQNKKKEEKKFKPKEIRTVFWKLSFKSYGSLSL